MPILAKLLSHLLDIYMVIVIANVLLSWIVFGTQNLVVRRIYVATGQLVDPVLQPIRNLIYPMTRNIGIDFSPIVLIVLLQILSSWLRPS
ncbi:YggT family protein [Candidatus Poribacteria bacterium]|nr:YggT family protein [Candidatus Poribacteria bacterium]